MPRGKVKMVDVNREVFDKVLDAKKSSIRKLAKIVTCSDKTIRRELGKGGLRPQYVDEIAKVLNVDPRLLTGELVKKAYVQYKILRVLRAAVPC